MFFDQLDELDHISSKKAYSKIFHPNLISNPRRKLRRKKFVQRNIRFLVTTHEADLTQVNRFDDLVKNVVDQHGKLDVLFNNAGILGSGNIGDISEEAYDSLSDILLKGPIFMTQAAMPYLKETKGCIVNTSSASATTDFSLVLTVYATMKASLIRFTQMTAADGVKNTGVRCNAIAPGVIDTNMTSALYFADDAVMKPLHQAVRNIAPIGDGIIRVEDVAATVAFLASHEARNITGQTITLDGGRGVFPDEAFMTRVKRPPHLAD